MAKHYYFLSLLLLLAITILNLRSISATTPSTLPPASNREFDDLVEALAHKEGFTIWAKLLAASKTKHVFPTKATLFVPTDAAISHLHYATDMNHYLIPYHITPQHHLLYSDLCHLKPLSLLPTLVPSKTIMITSSSPSSYRIDNSVITHPDLYISSRFVVHGINRILDLYPRRSTMPPHLLNVVGNVLGAANSQAAA